MSASTRILGATALALVVLLLVAAGSAPAADGPGGRPCTPVAVFATTALLYSVPLIEWKEEAAGRALAALAEGEFTAGAVPLAGESVIALPVEGGVMLGIVDQGAVCHVIAIADRAWRALREAVEGIPM